MNDFRKYSLSSENASDIAVEQSSAKFLFVDAGAGSFFNIQSLAENFVKQSKENSNKAVSGDCISLNDNILVSLKKLIRILADFDSINVFYDGQRSAFKNILPVVVLSRFFGKEVNLFYYPGEFTDKITRLQYKLFSFFSRIVVGSRYLARDLERKNIKAAISLPNIDAGLIRTRHVTEIQPHILFIHDNPDDSGAVCAMRAFKFVKQKYPRTEMTIVTGNVLRWQLSGEFREQNYSGIEYIEPHDAVALKQSFDTADSFINCTLTETIPQSLLLAMASGLPCISYETYGPREIIRDNVNGMLIRHNDSNQLADKIIELVEQPELAGRLSAASAAIKERLSINTLVRLLS